MDEARYKNLLNEYEEFAYVVSHDLAAPVRQLQGLTDILLKDIGSELSPQQQTYKDMIDHVAIEAERTLKALLAFSRLSTDKRNFDYFNLNELISDVLGKLDAKVKGSDCTISVDNMPKVYGDYKLLTQAFYHLIDNAIKFQPERQPPDIHIGVEQKKGIHVFSITDNGIGIDSQKIGRAFIILRQLNKPNIYKGRGVGLTFAKKIIEIHDGCIWLNSGTDKGTKMSFTLGLKKVVLSKNS